MNTVKSVGYGWGVLILAGGGAYYFAKKSINADRQQKAEADRRKREMQRQLEESLLYSHPTNPPPNPPLSSTNTTAVQSAVAARNGKDWNQDDANKPSQEASHDPAPTRHAPEDELQKAREKSKYEAAEPYRSRKGDRFS